MRQIPPFALVPHPLNEDAERLEPFKWASEEIGKRHRIGGEPEFLQKPQYPVCSCTKQMTFYGQLDSLNDAFVLADCGMIYVFVCFDCFETKSIPQSA